jgi:chemotaxis protein histidine kinase CheA
MTERIQTQKDNLARLMAGENLTVVHRKTPTAYFDLKNRLLCCPIFKEDISPELYDLFMGHEVGHALWTPYEGVHSAVTKNKTLKGYLNVVEDVRIERNIRNKYQGLRKSFFTAYNELMEMDFFGVKGKNLQELSLIDKINLITKCGSRINIKLTKEEQFFLDWAMKCETWEEVEECATAIYEWSKENETRTEQDEQLVPQMFDIGDDEEDEDGEEEEQEGESWEESYEDSEEEEEDNLPEVPETTGSGQETEEEESEEEAEEEERKETGGVSNQGTPEQYDDEDGARESITEHNAHNNEEQFISETNVVRTQIKLKEKGFSDFVTDTLYDYKLVLEDWSEYYEKALGDSYYASRIESTKKRGLHTFKKLESKNKAIINHMAKEFEMRQTALNSRYAFTGKTGKLDMNRLAKYQIVDDVFKRVTYLPDGKNHGVNIMLDWSGSICNEVQDLLEQTFILTMFCRKVNIPHRVYLFSDNIAKKPVEVDDHSSYWRDRSGYLVEIFSNEMNSKEYKEMFLNMSVLYNHYMTDNIRYGRGGKFAKKLEGWNNWFEGCEYIDPDQHGWIDMPTDVYPSSKYSLGGTPLDTTLVAMRGLLPKFNKAYGIEKSILTVITDGFSHSADILNLSEEEQKEQREQMGDGDSWDFSQERDIIDPINGRVYPYEVKERRYYRNDFKKTQNLLDWVSQTTGVTVTGYFVCGRKGDMVSLLQSCGEIENTYDHDGTIQTMWTKARKEGVVIKVHGYNKLFLTSASNLGTDGTESLDDELIGAKKSTILSKFKKNQNAKSTSRFLTNEFIKEIA